MILNATETAELLEFARSNRRKGSHGVAAGIYRILYLTHPSRADFLLEAAVSLRNTGQLAEADSWFDELLVLSPAHYGALMEAALCKLCLHKYSEALILFRKAFSAQPTAQAAMWSGVSLRRLDRCLEAIAPLDQALALDSALWSAEVEKAGCLESLGRFEEAISCYQHLLNVATKSSNPFLYNRLGICLERTKKNDALRALIHLPDYCDCLTEPYSFVSTVLWSLRLRSPLDRAFIRKFLEHMPKPVPTSVASALSLWLGATTPDDSFNDELHSILRSDNFSTSALATTAKFPVAALFDLLSQADFEHVDRTVERLTKAIHLAQPFSLVRLGDGEGNFLGAAMESDNPFLLEFRTQILNTWFGSNHRPVDAHRSLLQDLQGAIANADFLGVPDRARILYEQSNDARGFWGVYFAAKYAIERTRIRHCVSPVVHLHLFKDPGFLDALSSCREIHTITCHSGFGSRIRKSLRVARGVDLIVPGEKGSPILPDHCKSGEHYPDVYSHTIEQIRHLQPGTAVLVAAGVCGKVYANAAKSVGCMGIDIGAIVDCFMGVPSRAVFLEESFADRLAPTLRQARS